MSYEIRKMSLKTPITITEDGDEKYIEGMIPYNSRSEDMGFIEVIKPGAFKKSIKDKDIRCLWNHVDRLILGKTSNGRLIFEDGEDGLHFKVKVPMTRSYGLDAYDVVKTGDADGVSFGFRVINDTWKEGNDVNFRELTEVELREVSIGVTFPAYPNSKAQARAFDEVTGIDLSKFVSTLVRGEELGEQDKAYMNQVITQLRTLTGELKTEPAEDHSETEIEPTDVTLRKMQLELLAKSFQ